VEPGKRPRSSMAPTIAYDEAGRVAVVAGSPGGSAIIDYVVKTLLAIIDRNSIRRRPPRCRISEAVTARPNSKRTRRS
jgi:gamma-glutamyltranspeptidase